MTEATSGSPVRIDRVVTSGTFSLDGDNNVAGNSHAAATKRVFRRKSG